MGLGEGDPLRKGDQRRAAPGVLGNSPTGSVSEVGRSWPLSPVASRQLAARPALSCEPESHQRESQRKHSRLLHKSVHGGLSEQRATVNAR